MGVGEVTLPGGSAVTCEDLVKVFRSATGETHALRGIGLEVHGGVLAVVAGPSGSGKSSLLTLLGARDRPSAGRLTLLGADVGSASTRELRALRRRRIGFVPQRSSAGVFPHLRAVDQLRQVAAWRGVRGIEPLDAALEAVGLTARADHRPPALSGGEQQRLAVAMALVGRPALVVADEPTAELDHANADLVMDALLATAATGSAVVISSHDDRVTHRADRLLRLRHGVLSSETTRRRVGVGDMAVIDATGRLQLPPDLLELFPDRRVVVEADGDGVRLRPPREES